MLSGPPQRCRMELVWSWRATKIIIAIVFLPCDTFHSTKRRNHSTKRGHCALQSPRTWALAIPSKRTIFWRKQNSVTTIFFYQQLVHCLKQLNKSQSRNGDSFAHFNFNFILSLAFDLCSHSIYLHSLSHWAVITYFMSQFQKAAPNVHILRWRYSIFWKIDIIGLWRLMLNFYFDLVQSPSVALCAKQLVTTSQYV